MIKRICDCCGKEVKHSYESFERIWYGYRRLDACAACYGSLNKLKDKAIHKATKEFLKKKGHVDIPEGEDE